MLVRDDASGTLLIGQPSHAWVSGQLARAWGNARFGPVAPFEEVCLAAEQHDIGMAEWDLAPTFNPDTGLPHSFTEMPVDVHLPLWAAAPLRLLRQSRYAALLTSMHGTRLYAMRDLSRSTPADAEQIRGYLGAQRRWQEELAASLGADADQIARNSQLLWTWDYMSLAVCLGWAPCAAADVPTADQPVSVSMAPGVSPRVGRCLAVALPGARRAYGPLRGPAVDRASRLARRADPRAHRGSVGDRRPRARSRLGIAFSGTGGVPKSQSSWSRGRLRLRRRSGAPRGSHRCAERRHPRERSRVRTVQRTPQRPPRWPARRDRL